MKASSILVAFAVADESALATLNRSPPLVQWESGAPLPSARFHMGLVAPVLGNYAYVIGGQADPDGDGPTSPALNTSFRYPVASGSGGAWEIMPPMQEARHLHASATFRDKVYVTGGQGEWWYWLSSVEVFDGEKWTFAPNMTQTRCRHSLAAYKDQYLFAIGTYIDPNTHPAQDACGASIERFDGSEWTRMPDLPNWGNCEPSTAIVGDTLFVIGGIAQDVAQSTVMSLDVSQTDSQWRVQTPLHTPRTIANAAVFGNKIYIVGGDNPHWAPDHSLVDVPQQSIEVGTVAQGVVSWEFFDESDCSSAFSVLARVSFQYQNQIFLLGGCEVASGCSSVTNTTILFTGESVGLSSVVSTELEIAV